MRMCRLCLLRSARKGLVLACVTLLVYVLLAYNVFDDVTKHSAPLFSWQAGNNNNLSKAYNSATLIWTTQRTPVGHVVDAKNTSTGGDAAGKPTQESDVVQPDWRGKKWEGNGSTLLATMARNGSQSTEPVRSDSLLLAGVPRDRVVEFTIGLVTVSRDKEIYFFDTLSSLLARSTVEEQREITIVIMLADRNATFNSLVLKSIRVNYARQLTQGLLLVVRGADTDFLFRPQVIAKRTYNDSMIRVQWRSKQNLDYAALMEFCQPLSTFYLHLEDDVTAAPGYVRHTRDFILQNSARPWAMLELCPHGFIGKLFHSRDLPKLVSVLRTFYLEQPCDFLIKPHFINMMVQTKPILRKTSLFFHRGKYSSLKTVTRKVDREDGANHNGKRRGGNSGAANTVVKAVSSHKNPDGQVYTDMTVFHENSADNAYNPQTSRFFWAVDVKEDQYFCILFDKPQRVSRVVVETGFSTQKRKDILHDGRVEIGRATTGITHQCADTQKVGNFVDGHFDGAVTSKEEVRCINIVINKKQSEWLIIRAIHIFSATT